MLPSRAVRRRNCQDRASGVGEILHVTTRACGYCPGRRRWGLRQHRADSGPSRQIQQNDTLGMLVPPENYSMVEDGIYRCSKLDAINISFLKSLELRSIVWINEEKPPRVLRQFIEEHSIRLFHMMNSSVLPEEDEITNLKYQEWMVLKPSLISKSIEIILDVTNQNCLVMDKSEVIVGILRHIQRWNYSSISNEYRLYASRASYKVEIFLELINIELLPHGMDTADDKDKDKDTDDASRRLDDAPPHEPPPHMHPTQRRRGTPPHAPDPPADEPHNTRYDPSASHSSSKAISIQRTPSTHDPVHPLTSPALRRLSIDHSAGVLPTPSPPLSSSVGRLSISTSPQIPKNLLKIVEMRKNKKKHNMELREKEKEKEESRPEPLPLPHSSDLPPALSPPSPLKTLSTTAVDTYRWPPAPPSPFALPPASSSSASSTDGGPPATAPDCDWPAGHWKLYKPRVDGTHVRRHGHAGRPPRPVLTAIRVQLPPETCLPAWFLELRALCGR